MFWGQTRLLLLLTIIHGVCCIDLFDATCSTGSCSIGESVTITCNVTHKLDTITLGNNMDVILLEYDFHKNKTQSTTDKKISITYTEENITVTISISNVQLSDKDKYLLFLNSVSSNNDRKTMDLNISGVDSSNNDGVNKKNKTHSVQGPSELKSEDGNNSEVKKRDSSASTAAIVILIALIVAALGYLMKKWNKNTISGIFKSMNCAPLVRRLSQAPLMGQEEPEEENTTMQPLPPTQTV